MKPKEIIKLIRSVKNDKLKQDLDAEQMTNNSLQAQNDKLVEELDTYKAKVKALETNAEKLKKELDVAKRYVCVHVFFKTLLYNALYESPTNMKNTAKGKHARLEFVSNDIVQT